MKGVVFIALFAFVAVQLCQSAPMPEEVKKEETTLPPAVPDATKVPVERSETKETKSPEVVATETTAKPEEKKS